MDQVMNLQMILLSKIGAFLHSQVQDIDGSGQFGDSIILPETEALIRGVLFSTKRRYLVFFLEIFSFIFKKIPHEEEKNYKYYLSHARTMIEIFAILLFLSSKSQKEQVAICITKDLYTLRRTTIDSAVPINEIKETYHQQYVYFKKFINAENIPIPSELELFTKKKYDNSPYRIKDVLVILTDDALRQACPILGSRLNASQIYSGYRYFSNYVHGNHLSAEVHGKEKFWVMAKMVILGLLMVELVDKNIVTIKKEVEYVNLLKEFESLRKDFLWTWNPVVK